MKKTYQTPMMDIEHLEMADIICSSTVAAVSVMKEEGTQSVELPPVAIPQ